MVIKLFFLYIFLLLSLKHLFSFSFSTHTHHCPFSITFISTLLRLKAQFHFSFISTLLMLKPQNTSKAPTHPILNLMMYI